MRRRHRLRWSDLPRLIVSGVVNAASLFGGKYHRVEGAHVIATDAAGRILAVRTWYLEREWMLPGGRVERGETPHEAAVRETKEETGLSVTVDRLLLVDAHRAKDVSFLFAAHVTGGRMAPQLGEIAEVGWVGREEISLTSPGLHRLLEQAERAGEGAAYLGLQT